MGVSDSDCVYFDHNATTPLDPRVRDAMLPWLGGLHGNPSSAHRAGRAARRAVDEARAQVAKLLGAEAEDIVFTGSGTEANNAVIATIADRAGDRGRLLITSLEHPSIHGAAARAAARGMEVRELAANRHGLITAEAVRAALTDRTRLVCVMLANNELGTVQPVAEIAEICARQEVPVLCDAVQAVGKIPVRVRELKVDYLCLGGHKFNAPSGVGALWLRPGAKLDPLLVGGAQEAGRRASTENVPSIVGLGVAAELARLELDERTERMRALRNRFEAGLARFETAIVHCQDSPRLPNTCHLALPGVSGHRLMLWLDEKGFAVSTGSACHAGKPQPSPALLAMGIAEAEALASLRISFGVTNSRQEIDRFLDHLAAGIAALR